LAIVCLIAVKVMLQVPLRKDVNFLKLGEFYKASIYKNTRNNFKYTKKKGDWKAAFSIILK